MGSRRGESPQPARRPAPIRAAADRGSLSPVAKAAKGLQQARQVLPRLQRPTKTKGASPDRAAAGAGCSQTQEGVPKG